MRAATRESARENARLLRRCTVGASFWMRELKMVELIPLRGIERQV